MIICDPCVDPRLVPEGSRPKVIAEHQDEYEDLPSVITPAGQVITRLAFTQDERRAVLEGKDLFITFLSRGMINPFYVTVGPVNWREAEAKLTGR